MESPAQSMSSVTRSVDAVGDDARADAEQQPVGDHHIQVREQVPCRVVETAPVVDHRGRDVRVLTERAVPAGPVRASSQRRVLPAPPAVPGMTPLGGSGQGLPVGGVGVVDQGAADPVSRSHSASE